MSTAALPNTLGPAERAAMAELVAFLRERFGVRCSDLRLFGSRARGEGHAESDLDILVVIDGMTNAERQQIWDFSGRLFVQHEVPVSTFTLTDGRWRELQAQGRLIAREIARDGIPL
ncbi:MAG: nucleotidyltransferase domain-containing protein [Planctomycetes bacterium]|jgi:predicted nucleotidyltransferase|nr:nucleotidyltransferase domain-containing protein [Planctomycetota bacterium]